MAASRSSTAPAKPARAAAAKRARVRTTKPAATTQSGLGPATSRGRSKAAEMLREIQIDGKALSIQIERLRNRFL